MKLIQSIKFLSDGTIGSLTGLNRYDEIEVFRAKFMDFSENLNQEMNWQEAYKLYREYLDKSTDNKNLNSIGENIKSFNTREDLKVYIDNLKLSKSELLKLGKELNCNVNAKDRKDKIIDWIINGTVGSKLRVEAIKMIDLSKK